MGVVVVMVVQVVVVVVVMVKADNPHADIHNGVLARYPGQDDYISELMFTCYTCTTFLLLFRFI